MTKSHDEFDETLRRAAAEYNRPPETVPRDDMWTAIQARRATPIALVVDDAARSAGSDARPTARGGRAATRWWALAAAASVLLATGVGIGRWSSGDVVSAAAPDARATAATADRGVPSTVGLAAAAPQTPAAPSPLAAAPDAAGQDADARSADARSADARSAAPARPARVATEPRDARIANATYTLATLEHLTDVEALLVTYRTEAADSAVNARLSTWARELVADTRLLLDSPAASDPRRRRLLEDLELVLVQLVQLDAVAPARQGAGSERDMIDGSMRRGQLLTRLRTAIPAGT